MFWVAFYGCLLAEVIPVPIEVPLSRKVSQTPVCRLRPQEFTFQIWALLFSCACIQDAGISQVGFLLGSCGVGLALTSEICLKGLPKTPTGEILQFKGRNAFWMWMCLCFFRTEIQNQYKTDVTTKSNLVLNTFILLKCVTHHTKSEISSYLVKLNSTFSDFLLFKLHFDHLNLVYLDSIIYIHRSLTKSNYCSFLFQSAIAAYTLTALLY